MKHLAAFASVVFGRGQVEVKKAFFQFAIVTAYHHKLRWERGEKTVHE